MREVVEHFGVRLAVSLGLGADGGAAHPAGDGHQPRHPARAAAGREHLARARSRSPSSAQALLELRLGEWGHDAMGFVAHVPHYVAQFDYPAAAAEAAGVASRW